MSLLDDVMPEYEFAQRVAIPIHTPPASILRALHEVTLDEMPLANGLGTIRYLPARLLGRMPAKSKEPFFEQLLRGGNVVLAERPGKEVILGAIGKFHQVLDQEPVKLRDAAHFRSFDDPAYQKLVIDIRVERNHHRKVVLEARTHALSDESKRAFARYWIVIKPLGNFVSWLLLRAARRHARRA